MVERKRAEAALHQNEKRFRALVEHSSDAVNLLAPDGTILYATPATAKILGYAPGELLGRRAAELRHPDDFQDAAIWLAKVIDNPGSVVTVQSRY